MLTPRNAAIDRNYILDDVKETLGLIYLRSLELQRDMIKILKCTSGTLVGVQKTRMLLKMWSVKNCGQQCQVHWQMCVTPGGSLVEVRAAQISDLLKPSFNIKK